MSLELINAKDRIPVNVLSNGAIRYGRYDANGNLLGYEYMKREDEPIEEGTNVNKKLFDIVDDNFFTEQANRIRVDRYNVPKPNIISNETTELTTGDIIPKTWIEVIEGTKYQNENIILEASSCRDATSFPAKNACDGTNSNTWESASGLNHLLTLDFGETQKITKMKVYLTSYGYQGSGSNKFSSCIVQGSNDAINWDDLYTTNKPFTNLTEISLNNTGWYRYYRWNVTFSDSDMVFIQEWNISEHYKKEYNNILSLNGAEFDKITEYENNSIVNIQIPSTGILVKGDIIPKTWETGSTGDSYINYKSGNFEIFASSYYSWSFPALQAVDGDITSSWRSGNGTSHYLTLKLNKAIIVTKFKIRIGDLISPIDNWKIQGSNDNSSWNDLLTVYEMNSSLTEYELNNNNAYLYYRIYATSVASSRIEIYEIETSEYYTTIEDYPNSPNYLSLNNLEPKEIIFDKIIKAGETYQLIYKGDKFYGFNVIDSINRNLSIKTGKIADGGVIPKTQGFDNYAYIVSPASGSTTYSIKTSTGSTQEVTVAISCSVNQSTRVVTAKVSGTSGTANYIEIAWN